MKVRPVCAAVVSIGTSLLLLAGIRCAQAAEIKIVSPSDNKDIEGEGGLVASAFDYSVAGSIAPVAEPTSTALAALGILVLVYFVKRRRVRATLMAAIVLTLPGAIVYGQGQTLEKQLVHDRLQRDYTLYVPPNYNPQAALPLVVNMHPYGSNRQEQRLGSGMNAVAEREGFLVAYPDAVNGDWFTGQDNVGFIDRVIGEVSSQYSVNASQVYATGFSQGAFMSYILSAERPYTFAAIAPVAGTYNVNPTRPTPLLHIHGTADTFVSYSSVDPIIRRFVTRNGGDLTPSITDLPDINTSDGTTVQLLRYGGGNYLDNAGKPHEAEVLLYRIQNGGHNWPGDWVGWPDNLAPVNYDISASTEIWKFFRRHEVAAVPISTWNVDANANWSEAANWAGGVPNAVGVSAVLGGEITEPRTVTLTDPVTVGRLDFDSAATYTIAGVSRLRIAGGNAQINVTRGSHVIAAPLTLAENTLITVAPPAGNLALSGALFASTADLTKAGAGTLTVNTLRAISLAVDGGTVAIAPNGTSAGTSAWYELTLAGAPNAWTAKLDVANNDAILRSTAASKAADFGRLHNQLKQGFNNGTWTGLGITSASAAANASGDTGVAVVDNALLGLSNFSGQSVTADSILLKYTYYGDIDQNGQVDADDLTVFASNFGRAAGATHVDGDIDFNGAVNADDLTVFANNFNKGVGNPLAAESVKAVPEPGTLVLAAVAAAAVVFVRLRARGQARERG